MSEHIIAVDFDGTLCENAWPGIGSARAGVIDYVLEQQMTGAKIILWTNRRGEKLAEAVAWCAARGLARRSRRGRRGRRTLFVSRRYGNGCEAVRQGEKRL